MRLKESNNLIRERERMRKIELNLFSILFRHENNKKYKF